MERRYDGRMVSVSGTFDLRYERFEDLVDRRTMRVKTRNIRRGSDLHLLPRYLETGV